MKPPFAGRRSRQKGWREVRGVLNKAVERRAGEARRAARWKSEERSTMGERITICAPKPVRQSAGNFTASDARPVLYVMRVQEGNARMKVIRLNIHAPQTPYAACAPRRRRMSRVLPLSCPVPALKGTGRWRIIRRAAREEGDGLPPNERHA